MINEWLVTVILPVLIAALIIVVTILSIGHLGKWHPTRMGLIDLKQALEVWAYKGLHAAVTMLANELGSVDKQLLGTNIVGIANATYNTLPQVLMVGKFMVPIREVKAIITPEVWLSFVQQIYHEAEQFVKANEAYLVAKAKEYSPPSPVDAALPSQIRPGY